jgi:hypothetical protein
VGELIGVRNRNKEQDMEVTEMDPIGAGEGEREAGRKRRSSTPHQAS